MLQVQLRSKASKDTVKTHVAHHADPAHAAIQVHGSAKLYKPDGKLLLVVVRGGVSEEAKASALPFLEWLGKYESYNRGAYAGTERFRRVKKDGTTSNTSYATSVRSAVVGFMDRYPRIPFCRESAFSMEKPEMWGASQPLIREVSDMMRLQVPERWRAQATVAGLTHPSFVIPGTPFTTLTVNNTVSGAYHIDKGDYEPGFGAMSVFRRGTYHGCLLVFPAYGVGVDLADRDLILFDPHEVHGNTPFYGTVGEERTDWARVSVVYYFRQKMVDCGTPEEELKRAQERGHLGPEPE